MERSKPGLEIASFSDGGMLALGAALGKARRVKRVEVQVPLANIRSGFKVWILRSGTG